jgi:hypothetical protein
MENATSVFNDDLSPNEVTKYYDDWANRKTLEQDAKSIPIINIYMTSHSLGLVHSLQY